MAYISAFSVAFSAGITCLIMRGRSAEVPRVSDGRIVTARPFTFFSNHSGNVVVVIQREGRGHPGYLIRCLETGAVYPSQGEAANVMSVWPSVISDHLNGKVPDVHGLHFQRIGVT